MNNIKPENFCYWLQGFFEISGAKELNAEQTDVVKEHLGLVFNKVTEKKVQEGQDANKI